ncbi:MAG: hypothetical protein HS107_12680 [Thermoflexaceae bacterium]|nr:hypothetical protein [Thermoflexaceae bacterium]
MKLALLSLIVLPLLAFAACGDDDSGPRPGEDTPAESPSGGATPTAAQLEQLTTTEVPGFERSESRLVAGSGSVLYTSSEKTAGGASVLVSVRLSACDPSSAARSTQRTAKAPTPSATSSPSSPPR